MIPLLAIEDLHCRFDTPGGPLHAVRGVSLEVAAGETLGLVGESGSGKTTLAKSIVGLVRPTAGRILLEGQDLATADRTARFAARRAVQFVFQDPFASLNPRRRVAQLIREPLDVHRIGTAAERDARVAWLMARVGLRPEWGHRLPHEFSGGQRQRIGIARALSLTPRLIVCDEPVSALDVSIQAQVINLLADLQRELGIAYLVISHDLALVETFAHRIAVMYLGRIVEIGPAAEVWRQPHHPFTRALIDAVPVPDPAIARLKRPILEGDPPSPLGTPPGCAFAPRCPLAVARCHTEPPLLRPVGEKRIASCHLVN
ncbi:MAG: ABC transporter ATP-binding protein [Alphaproteobacteria bacterium]|nr:ABC transporter ATP-binding protein [Alphaproteobacteria bacterium]